MTKFRINAILHSGRKGTRGTPVDDPKYDGMVGSEIMFEEKDILRFKSLHFFFTRTNYPHGYKWFETSAVLGAHGEYEQGKQIIVIETENTLYRLYRLDKQDGNESGITVDEVRTEN